MQPTANAEELQLCRACVSGDPEAVRRFDERYLSQVGDWVSRIDSSPAFADEVRQQLRTRLLTGPAPKIAAYEGRGPLGGWMRTAAVRLALELRREKSPPGPPDAAPIDPELAFLKDRYRDDCQQAFAGALASLTSKERNLLRLHYLDKVTLDALATLYRVHRATAAQWLASARQTVLLETRQRLAEKLSLRESEIESLIDLVQSQLEVSLRSSVS